MKTYSLCLSTSSVINPPRNDVNLGNVSWLVDWDYLFKNKLYKECNIRAELISLGDALDQFDNSWDNNILTVRLNIPSSSSSHYGVVLGHGHLNLVPFQVNAENNYYFHLNTLNSNGVTCNLPSGKSLLTVAIVNYLDAIIEIPEYQIVLYFDILE